MWIRALLAPAVACAALLGNAALAGEMLRGPATVIDGDTIEVAGERLRLYGIDAPELEQTCRWPSKEIACGVMARAALMDLTAGIEVRCGIVGPGTDGRRLARCSDPHGADLGANMAWTGWALALRQTSADYVGDEAAARDGKRGLWKGAFVPPWEWRRNRQ